MPLGAVPEELDRIWKHIYGEGPGHLALFSGSRSPSAKYPNKNRLTAVEQKYFRWPEEADEAARWVFEESEGGREVYHCGHLVTCQRRRKEDAAPMLALYVDGDGAKVPEGIPQPTTTVQSSPGREQFYYKLTRPIPPELAEQLNKRLAYAMGADKSGYDLTQVLRIPGTQNHKYEDTPTVEIKEIVDKVYDPDHLDRVLPPLEEEQNPKGKDTPQDDPRPPLGETEESPVRLDDYGMRVWKGENPKLTENGSEDRSASLMKIARVLCDAGATRNTIVNALEERDESLGWEKYTHRKDSEKQYERIVDKLERNDGNPRGSGEKSDDPHSVGRRVPLGEIIRQGIKPPEELVEGILLKGKVHQLYAAPAFGKSWVALWLAKELINRGKPVLYLDMENGPRIIAERLKALGAEEEKLDEHIVYYSSPGLPMTAEGIKAYVRLLEEVGPALVVFDSWVNFLSGAGLDENVSSDVSAWSLSFSRPARDRGITVLLLDHVPKEGSTARGSGRKKEEMDVQWQLKNPKPFDRNTMGEIHLVREKDREGWLPKVMKFSVGGTEDNFVFEGLDEFATITKISDLKPNQKKILKVLKTEFGDEGATAPEWQKACDEVEGVPKSSFYKAKKTLIEGEHYFVGGDRFYPQAPQEEEGAA